MKPLHFIIFFILLCICLFLFYIKNVKEDIYNYCGFKVIYKEVIEGIETKYKYYLLIESPKGIQKDIFVTEYDYFHISIGETIKCNE